MERLNSRQRREKYDKLVERDGEYCKLCNGDGYYHKGANQLEIDRKNPRKGYADLSNLQLAHHDCNCAKNTRGKGKYHPTRARTFEELEPKKVNTVEMEKHLFAHKRFRLWLLRKVRNTTVLANKKLLNSAAEHCRVTQQTIQRYLDVITSDEGPLMIDDTTEIPTIIFREEAILEGAEDEALDARELARNATK